MLETVQLFHQRRALDQVTFTGNKKLDSEELKKTAALITGKKIGISDNVETQVLKLARLAKEAGLDGVVASPIEIKAIRKSLGRDFLIVTPGVRPEWAAALDQKRIATPKDAIRDGADFIVVGRPVTEAAIFT